MGSMRPSGTLSLDPCGTAARLRRNPRGGRLGASSTRQGIERACPVRRAVKTPLSSLLQRLLLYIYFYVYICVNVYSYVDFEFYFDFNFYIYLILEFVTMIAHVFFIFFISFIFVSCSFYCC